MNREVHVRICEGLGVKFPGPTRHERHFERAPPTSAVPPKADIRLRCNICRGGPRCDIALRHVPAVHHEALDTGLAAEGLPLSDRNKLLHECLG